MDKQAESQGADWSRPAKVTGVEMVFGGDMRRLMVPYDSIPEDFRRERGDAKKWVALQQEWFFRGLGKVTFVPKEGIDTDEALRHLKAIQGSFEPKHEHKEACVAYLMSLWFEDVKRDEVRP